MTGWRTAAGIAAMMVLAAAAPAGSDGDPGGYRLRLPLSITAGARVQRLTLPAAVLARLRTRDGHDLRIFDARGRAMPIARDDVSAALRRDRLDPMPILGAPDALRISDVSLRLDGRGAAQVAEVRGTPVTSGGAPVLLGVLLDARRVAGRARRLSIDADLPSGQPVTLVVEASTDLRDWRPLGEATVYRRSDEPARATTVPLHDATLAGAYLRIRWNAGSRLLKPVTIRGVALDTRPDGAATVTIDARLSGPFPDPARTIDLAIPFATPMSGARVLPVADDGVIPVRILGRDDREEPWAVLGRGLARHDGARDIVLTGDTPRILRIEADARGPGFGGMPRLQIGFAGQGIVFLASGVAPFTLSAGRTGAGDVFLSREDLTAGEESAGTARISSGPAAVLQLSPPADDGAATRSVILWGILLAATALIGGIACRLWRQNVRDRPAAVGE